VRREDVPDPPPGLRAVEPREWVAVWNRVLDESPVKNVGYCLAARADYKTGADIHPGTELLMKMSGIKSDKTVREALKRIREMGFAWRYLEGSKAPFIVTRKGRIRPSDEYRLTWPDDISGIPMLNPDDMDGDLALLAALWITREHR
jgi:hypothetical protein